MTKKTELIIAILGLIIAIVGLLFGDNIYQQITGRSIYNGGNIQHQSTSVAPTSASGLAISSAPTELLFGDGSHLSLYDKFDTAVTNYDQEIWNCDLECNTENVAVKDGVLLLQRSSGGSTSLTSRSEWMYSNLVLLTGKIRIRKGTTYSAGWISMSNIAGCAIENVIDVQSPSIACSFGSTKAEYLTKTIPAEFDRWYQIRIEFNQEGDTTKFYIDNTLLGEHVVVTYPYSGQVSLGIVSNERIFSLSQINIDDISVTVNK